MPIVIRNGRVIDPSSNTDRVADVLIVDGRVATSRAYFNICSLVKRLTDGEKFHASI